MAATSVALLHLTAKGLKASGFESAKGFVVRAGSEANAEESNSAENWLRQSRHGLKQNGILVPQGNKLVLTQDYTFNSPSAASTTLLGRNDNGRESWRTKAGISLKKVQEQQASFA